MKYIVDGKLYEPVKVGDEGDWAQDGRKCGDCGAASGEFHKPGCDCERCPVCGLQLISCDCEIGVVQEGAFLIEIRSQRVRTENYQPGLFYYHIRHSDSDWGKPVTMEKHVVVNHYGTLISTINLDSVLGDRGFYQFKVRHYNVIYNQEDCGFFDGRLLFSKLG